MMRPIVLRLFLMVFACPAFVSAQDYGGIYADGNNGTALDTITEVSRGPMVHTRAGTGEVVVSPRTAVVPQLSAATQNRNRAAANAGRKAIAVLHLLETDTASQEQLQAAITEFADAQNVLVAELQKIEVRIVQSGLADALLQRQRQLLASIQAEHAQLQAKLAEALTGDLDARSAARQMLLAGGFAQEPTLLHSSPNYSMPRVPAPQISRDAALSTPLGSDGLTTAAIDPPTGADLAETVEITFAPEIVAKAAELGNSPLAIYEFVRNEVAFQPYLGSRKGALETLRQLRGNDTDQASLLLALLRTSGIPSRYVRGTVEGAPDAVANWQQMDDPAEAAAVLTTAGLDGVSIVNGPDVVAVRFTHVWVEAYVPYTNYRGAGTDASGHTWVPLAPAYVSHDIQPGLDTLAALAFDEDAFVNSYISAFTEPSPLQTFQAEVQSYLDANDPGKTFVEVERTAQIAAQELGLLPASLPFAVLSLTDRLAELEDNKRYKVRLQVRDGGLSFFNQTLNLSDIAGKRVTVEYVGATPADQSTIDAFDGLYETPPNLVDVTANLKVDSAIVAAGVGGIGLGRNVSFTMEFQEPLGASNAKPLIENTQIAGNGFAVGFDTFLDVRNTLFEDLALPPSEQLDAILHTVAIDYLNLVSRAEEATGRLMGLMTTQDVSEVIASNSIAVGLSFGNPVSFEWNGLTVDADRHIVGRFPVNGDNSRVRPMTVVAGVDGSYSENRVFETIFDQEAVSTIKILERASDAGIAICTITSSIALDCPGFSHSASVSSAVNAALAQGNRVIIPAQSMTIGMWVGTGYIDQEPNGAAGYIISGGISSSQNLAGGATVDSWPIFLPCDADDVSGNMTFPSADAPSPDALFCPANATITFQLELTTTCKNGDIQVQNLSLTTHKTTKQFGPGTYNLVLQAFGTQILRTIKIGEAKIVMLTPAELPLGEDLTVNYEIDIPGINPANLEIKNAAGTKVFEKTNITATEGAHQETWPKGTWNQAPNAGAFANPKNGDYEARITGMLNGQTCEFEPKPFKTKLMLETVVEDKLATGSSGTQVAGLADMLDALKIVMKKGADETEISGAAAINVTDESGGSKTLIKKRIKVDDPALNSLDSGMYDVLMKDLRDEIGNFADENNNPADGITPVKAGEVNLQ